MSCPQPYCAQEDYALIIRTGTAATLGAYDTVDRPLCLHFLFIILGCQKKRLKDDPLYRPAEPYNFQA